ncbi:hypothetical protein B0H34DRAFT_793259 [Crassisporium funariophilum]|nr:hypothetical protein B0H34DRAFT_793259 [Crassisporium funariophilum]
MRLRIQTYSPLPDLKAWFVPDVQSVPGTIHDLKEALCSRFQALKERHYHGQDLILLLEDFELLNDSPFSAVRDGDLICVKLSPFSQVDDVRTEVEHEISRDRKRKRSSSGVGLMPGRPARTLMIPPSAKKVAVKHIDSSGESGSESDSSSASSTSSSSSSSSQSASSSSSSPSSSSDSSSPPKPLPSKNTKASTIPISSSTIPHVPPGLGKPSTQSRNLRRRRKLMYLKEESAHGNVILTPASKRGTAEAIRHPLGSVRERPSDSGTLTVPPDPRTVPLPASPPQTMLASTSTANAGPAAHKITSTSTPTTKKGRNRRDRDGPASDVASALSNAFELNAKTGIYAPGTLLENNGADPSVAGGGTYITQEQLMMGSLRNKNKKKGFKQSMANPIPQKIIFTNDVIGPPSQTVAGASTQAQSGSNPAQDSDMLVDIPSTSYSALASSSAAPAAASYKPRLVPPSELQELGQLPSNMFVTSVDVEAGIWNEQKPSKKRKGKKNQSQVDDYDGEWYDDSTQMDEMSFTTTQRGQFDDADAPVNLPYSDADAEASLKSEAFDWSRAEKHWKDCVVLNNVGQLAVGNLVGWQGLAINPRTFSPEVLLTVARVVALPPGPIDGSPAIIVRHLKRHGASQAAFAFGLSAGEEGDDNDDEEVEEVIKWPEALTNQWRLINS